MTPKDANVYTSEPTLYASTCMYNEIHISVAFTWDLRRAAWLAAQWAGYGTVLIGGPAVSGSHGEFIAGKYLRQGVTITSRGCPNHCPWCFVPEWEGPLKELPIVPGHIIQDNNLLACSENHIKAVFDMLRTQKDVDFAGGLESLRLTNDIVDELRKLDIYQIWLSWDSPSLKNTVEQSIELLRSHFDRRQTRCYVLIGYKGDTLEAARSRLEWVVDAGALPFAMRYRGPDGHLFFDRDWNQLIWEWSRVTVMMSKVEAKT